jgi:hypothetical protein
MAALAPMAAVRTTDNYRANNLHCVLLALDFVRQ